MVQAFPIEAGAPPERPGKIGLRREHPRPDGYVVFDCETTGTDDTAEIVSLALVRLDADGNETGRRAWLVRPWQLIPAEATAVHGISDGDVAGASTFTEIAAEVLGALDGAVFVAHNASFDLRMLQRAFAGARLGYLPPAVACTLEAFRLLEPLADNHRLQSLCERHGIALGCAHEALGDVLGTVALLRLLLDDGLAPETVELDEPAYHRLRSRGDTRPASEPQIRRVFGLARPAGLVGPDGRVDRDAVLALAAAVVGTTGLDTLTRAQVQDLYDALERLAEARAALATAATA